MFKPTTILSVGVLLSSAVLTGCGSTPSASVDNGDLSRRAEAIQTQEAVLAEQQSTFEAQQSALEARRSELLEREAELQEAAKLAASSPVPIGGGAPMGDNLLPPEAKPGECFARVYTPPTYKNVSEQVLKRAESSRVEVVPATYATATEEVLVREESRELKVIPATYEWVTEEILVTPATSRLETVPAEMETVTERVMVKAGYTTWKKGSGPIQRLDTSTGEIMCLVEVPPVYETITKTVERRPASTRTVDIPAVYKTVKRKVVKDAARTEEVVIPAEYKTVSVQKIVEPAREVSVAIPAEYQTVDRREMVTAGGLEWRSILCDTNTTPTQVKAIQRALQAAGYNPGPIDGVIKSRTMSAVNAYQRDNNLPVDDYLNMETVRSLGVAPGSV